jgi:hypothetical protein
MGGTAKKGKYAISSVFRTIFRRTARGKTPAGAVGAVMCSLLEHSWNAAGAVGGSYRRLSCFM